MFAPIAIVARACVLPGALTPEDLWTSIAAGRNLIGPPPNGHWGLDPARVLAEGPSAGQTACSQMGGYVSGFEGVFDADGFCIPAQRIEALDPLVKWLLHCGREALRDAGVSGAGDVGKVRRRTGVILGNLSYPTRGLAEFAQSVWLNNGLGTARLKVPENRFNSGYPTHLLAQALDLGGDAFALDAACASSLYAIKLACDRLHDGDADLMLAGAVNRADDLYLHIGFTVLRALSASGRSRPFDTAADGLLPAEGAAIIALKRLDDAILDGNRIHGVIRGIGLSNDGRQRGFLAPDTLGQVRAMRAAYKGSGLGPEDVSYVECHATGTPVGDAIEIASMAQVFGSQRALAVGSLKSNMGHLITASGAAGLLKVLAMMEAKTLAPTLNIDQPIDAFDGRPFRPQLSAVPWESKGPRRAAVNSFGFGGNNAHLIVEAFDKAPRRKARAAPIRPAVKIAICGIGVVAGNCRGIDAFAEALADSNNTAMRTTIDEIELPLKGLRFPPNDLSISLPQQPLMIEAAIEAVSQTNVLPADRTGVLVGMGCDAESARYGLCWRLLELLQETGTAFDPDQLDSVRLALVPALTPAGVVGAMPNIPANRLNVQFDCTALGFTVSSEELSGLTALKLASRALAAGELDAALVGAVDLSVEPVHLAAAEILFPADRRRPGDAAVAMVLKRLDDAERDGDTIFAVLGDDCAEQGEELRLHPSAGESIVTRRFGHAHAASGLLHVAAAVLPSGGGIAARPYQVAVSAFSGQQLSVRLLVRPGARSSRSAVVEGDGQTLRIAAHYPPLRLDELTRPADARTIAIAIAIATAASPSPSTATAPVGAQVMAPAPVLPPVAEQAPVGLLQPATFGARHEAALLSESPKQLPVRSNEPPHGTPAARVVARTAALHRDFVDSQTRVYREFLSRQEAILRRLESARVAMPKSSPRAPVAALPATLPVTPPATLAATLPARANGVNLMPKAGPSKALHQSAGAAHGPSFTRQHLEQLAGQRIADVFGPAFERQAGYLRQVRMPEPPLLLADRVTGIAGEPGSMGKGSIWTETDIGENSWYLHHGHMPPGIIIESGQADLLLISWLGADFVNKGERVYRLLGCELTFHEGGLPKPGDTLRYDIHVDGHAKTGDVRLFFFHYDCQVGERTMLSVREGQAGFFTDQELDNSGGVLWRAEHDTPKPHARMDPTPGCTHKHSFSADDVAAFVAGNTYQCFGSGFEMAAAHQRSPNTPGGRMGLIGSVPEFAPAGGPWGRGYLRAETHVPMDTWFYQGHFKNDPCMPGTLMADAAVQAMAFAMAAMGFTIARDGWRFEPVTEEAFVFLCRGQVVPNRPHTLSYEVFIEEVIDGETPTIYAALLCSSDGFKVFQCRRFGLKLVPDWPLTTRRHLIPSDVVPTIVSPVGDVRGDYSALLACAWGAPSSAFGAMYHHFDGSRRMARLPGPPYNFMSRVSEVGCAPAKPLAGGHVIAEYDVPAQAWYFADNGRAVMPFSVLLEVLLQPCGWLAVYMGFALKETDLAFRNLDGDEAVAHQLVDADVRLLRTRATLTRFSQAGEMTIVFFRVECESDKGPVYSMNTSFGFFASEALANQVGLATSDADRARRDMPCELRIDLRPEPPEFFQDQPRLAGGKLRMIDEITGYWPDGGAARLGRIRGRQAINPDAWYFKAHFFQDPVQPGSLGLEALVQLLQAATRLLGLGKKFAHPRFEPIAVGEALSWKYRGQVTPTNQEVVTELEITSFEDGPNTVTVTAAGSLWVDGFRIYAVQNLATRIVAASAGERYEIRRLDVSTMPWIGDHRPTYTLAALPMMAEIAFTLLAVAANSHSSLVTVEDFRLFRWLTVPDGESVDLRITMGETVGDALAVRLTTGKDVEVAAGRVRLTDVHAEPPTAWPAHDAPPVEDDLYQSGALFHGPSLQVMRGLRRDEKGASFVLHVDRTGDAALVALLDGALHGIPHDIPQLWFGTRAADCVAYPQAVVRLNQFGPIPATADLRVEARPEINDDSRKSCRVKIQIIAGDAVWCDMVVEEVLLPKGPVGRAGGRDRRAFLQAHDFVPALGLSQMQNEKTVLSKETVLNSNWLPGTLETTYRTAGSLLSMTREIAIKEHVAQLGKVHPSTVLIDGDDATCPAMPGTRFTQRVEHDDGVFTVTDAAAPLFDPATMRDDWRRRLGVRDWPVEEIYFAVVRRFVRSVRLQAPEALASIRHKPALFLANHQVGIESLTFAVIGAVLSGRPLVTIAKGEHRNTWLGRLIAHCRAYPGVRLPRTLMFFDRDDQASMLTMMQELQSVLCKEDLSLMIHAEGTRSLQCAQPVRQMSGVFLDLALKAKLPIVPVRFCGGLPREPLAERLEFPLGYGAQDIHVGRPIDPSELADLPLGPRREKVLAALNSLGPDLMVEQANDPDPVFAEGVEALMRDYGLALPQAAVMHALESDPDTGEALRNLAVAVRQRQTIAGGDSENEWLCGLANWFQGGTNPRSGN